MKSVQIDFEAKTARIFMKSGKQIDRQTVEDTLRPGGYGVTSFEEQASASVSIEGSP